MNTDSSYINFFNFIDIQNNDLIEYLKKQIENETNLYQKFILQTVLIKIYETVSSSNYLIVRKQVNELKKLNQD